MSNARSEVRNWLTRERSEGRFVPTCDAWITGHDPDFSRRLAGLGWVGMTLPEQYGGRQAPYGDRHEVLEELLAAGAPVAAHWIADRQTGPLLLRYGSDRQRELFLPRITRGECFFALGMSEPNSGSDLASIGTSARSCAGGWRVNGTKIWSSHAHRSDYMLALVRTSPQTENKYQGMSQLIVDLHAEGVDVRPIRVLSGEPYFNEVVFRDAFVPADMLVGLEGDGWQQVTAELAYERSGPERFLSTFPLLAQALAELPDSGPSPLDALGKAWARLSALRALSHSLAQRLEAGEVPNVEAALLKDAGTRFEGHLIETVRSLISPNAASATFQELYWRAQTQAPSFTIRAGTSEILRGIVARSLRPAGLDYSGADDETRLVMGTAAAIFQKHGTDTSAALTASGLDPRELPDLATTAAVVKVSAYYAPDGDYAEPLLSDPADHERGALVRSLQLCGAMARVRDLTIAYAAGREQFGRPINKFQAVQQQLAEMAAEVALAIAAVDHAVSDPSRLRVALAKTVTGASAGIVAKIAHQVHGAIGFTQEYELHKYTSQLWRWRDQFGTETDWSRELGAAMLHAGTDGLWPLITAT